MSKLYNVSSSPHVRSRLTTGKAMYDVILTLMPATIMGVYHHGFHALLVILMAIVTAMATEFVYDYIAGKPNTLKDGSAIVTGLLLALCLPGSVPLYIPFAGSLFAILVVKCLFGGLGHNFMNPALAGRCFLLISFSGVVTNYTYDGVTTATPLVDLLAGESVNVAHMLTGMGSGVIGNSTIALFIGGMILWAMGGITFEIPVATIVSFCAFIAIFGGQGFDPTYILAHLAGGGVIMAAFFMATDPVTSPVTSTGQLLYGCLVGILSGLFRVRGSAADSVSYAVIISNMVVPLIEEITVPVPFGCREQKSSDSKGIPKSAIVLCVITLIAGVALSGVYGLTKDTIDEQQMAANAASYAEVCPDADSFSYDDTINAAVDALGGEVYGTDFGKSYINEVVVGKDSSGNVAGYVFSVTSGDAFDGTLTFALGISADGTVYGISFTELHDTAGMGMLCGESAFKDQFNGVNTDKFILNKSGGASADNEINSVSGASVSSGAVVNAVNAALDFFAANIK
jgi:RnfABCDGE-type electron transport complex G subunit